MISFVQVYSKKGKIRNVKYLNILLIESILNKILLDTRKFEKLSFFWKTFHRLAILGCSLLRIKKYIILRKGFPIVTSLQVLLGTLGSFFIPQKIYRRQKGEPFYKNHLPYYDNWGYRKCFSSIPPIRWEK
jgi:hypothetical protein